jgi:gamma-glutamylcyclotransferase
VIGDILYFAFGSNLDRDQMRVRCPNHEVLALAWLPDHRLAFTAFSPGWNGGVADVVQSPGDKVWGLLYRLTRSDLESLDAYEGHPQKYRRTLVKVEQQAEHMSEVWTYVVISKSGPYPPSGPYLAVIEAAGARLGFPRDYLDFLASLSQV